MSFSAEKIDYQVAPVSEEAPLRHAHIISSFRAREAGKRLFFRQAV